MTGLIRFLTVLWGVSVLLPAATFGLLVDQPSFQDRYQTHQLIIKVRPDVNMKLKYEDGKLSTSVASIDALHEEYQVRSQRPLLKKGANRVAANPLKDIYILHVDEDTDLEAMKTAYAALFAVEYAIPDYSVQLHDLPDDPLFPHQYALSNTGQGHYQIARNGGHHLITYFGTPDADIDADEVFLSPPDNTSTVVVAIVDTGVDWDHPDLASNMWNNPGEIPDNGIDDDHNGYVDDIVGWDFSGTDEGLGLPITEDNDPTDKYGHGTHCAGIVASIINNSAGVAGVVPDARIMALKFYPLMTLSMAANAIIYAADNGADVINMSWGLGWEIPVVEDALEYAYSRGVVLVASAGNDGAEYVNYPASYPMTMAISASDADDHVTSFSTFSSFITVTAPGNSILSLRADTTDMYAPNFPGVHIIDDYYYLASGTSMSGPHAVAVAAYIRSVSPGLTHNKTKEVIQNSADDILDPYGTGANYPGWDKYSGHGRVNLANAIALTPRIRAILADPVTYDVLSGIVDIFGSADGTDFAYFTLEYGTGAAPTSWTTISSASSPVTDGLLGTWSTQELEGLYTIRLQVGADNVDAQRVYVANSPVAEIIEPAVDDTLTGFAVITGTAICTDFEYTVVEYGAGYFPTSWNLIDTVTTPVHDNEILTWDAGTLPDGEYAIRMSVYSASGLEEADTVQVFLESAFGGDKGWTASLPNTVGWTANYGDFDNDGLNEIVVGTRSGVVFFNTDGTPKTTGVPSLPAGDYRTAPAVVISTTTASMTWL